VEPADCAASSPGSISSLTRRTGATFQRFEAFATLGSGSAFFFLVMCFVLSGGEPLFVAREVLVTAQRSLLKRAPSSRSRGILSGNLAAMKS
jgi:hypothetical protein